MGAKNSAIADSLIIAASTPQAHKKAGEQNCEILAGGGLTILRRLLCWLDMQKLSDRRQTIIVIVLLAVATPAVYRQVRDHDFIGFDDDLYVTDNYCVWGPDKIGFFSSRVWRAWRAPL